MNNLIINYLRVFRFDVDELDIDCNSLNINENHCDILEYSSEIKNGLKL